MSTSNSERRVFSRINFDADTIINQGSNRWPVTLLDISLNGLLIEKPAEFQIDREQPLQAQIELNQDAMITMDVVWRHTESDHIGFECQHIDLESISHLRRLIELNLGNSSLLERQLGALGK